MRVVAAFYDDLAAGSVVRHRLAVIQHFISRLLQQARSNPGASSSVAGFEIVNGVTLAHVLLQWGSF